MEKLRNPRAILDRRRLGERLATIAGQERAPLAQRAAVLEALKGALAAGRAEIRARLESLPSVAEALPDGDEIADGEVAFDGRAVAAANCHLMDQLIRTLYDFTTTHVYPLGNPSAGERLTIAAVGGYGRGELAPHSDLDLLFLHPYKRTPHGEQVIEYMLYLLWDLRLKVGHAVRSVDDCIRQALADMTIRTGLLEARYVWGEESMFQELRKRFRREVAEGTGLDFVDAKLAERDERHRRMGNSRYALEPNIKEGKGGLRDLHTLFWIGKYLYRVDDVAGLVEHGVLTAEEAAKFKKAEAFLWTLRCHLHYLIDRPEERLSFDVQTTLAQRLGYTDRAGTKGVERLMKHYFLVAKTVGDLTRIFCAALEAQHRRRPFIRLPAIGPLRREVEGFPVEGGRLTVASAETFTKNPVNLLRLFEVAMRHDLDIHPAALRLVTRNLRQVDRRLQQNPEANRLFLEMLTARKDPEGALRRLSEAGVLGRFIPDFGRVVAQMQYDMYHNYTVDEHTLFAVGILHRLEQGALKEVAPIASDVVHKVLSRRVLYLALFLHDIAKGRGGDHSDLGAQIALKLGPRLGFSEEETETTAWLVQHHLLMSNTAFKRDIDDPKTISDFVESCSRSSACACCWC
jgi:[protein-PII] uridylyltransferase